VKNRKPHDVPLAESLLPVLAEHARRFPPVPVTLPWLVPDGEPQTFRLLLTWRDSALNRNLFNDSHWRPALRNAGIEPNRRQGTHVLRHTAASAWLSGGADIVAVAAWLGDTVQTVHSTYAHLMPDADARGRKAMDSFVTRAPSALDVPSGGAL
jgi:integrase